MHDSDEVFMWGLWALIRKENDLEIADAWEEQGREDKHGPFKGRLANSLKQHYSPDTFNLKVAVKIQPNGARPLLFVEEVAPPSLLHRKMA